MEPGPDSIASGDFNGDHRPDLAVAGSGHGSISILMRELGSPEYSVSQFPSQAASVRSLVTGDLDHDGRLDLIATTGSDLRVFRGDGQGTFSLSRSFPILSATMAIAQDLNEDGNLELAVGKEATSTVVIFRGDGTGDLAPGRAFAAKEPAFLVSADFDGSGHLDVAAADGSRSVTILLDKTFDGETCRRGNVNGGAGSIVDVLFINGSAGGEDRELVIDRNAPITVRMEPSPSGGTRFALYAWEGEPTSASVGRLPLGIGSICLGTPVSGGGTPSPRFLACNFAHAATLGEPDRIPHPAPVDVIRRMQGLRRSGSFFFQAIILDPGSSQGSVAVTNGVLVRSE